MPATRNMQAALCQILAQPLLTQTAPMVMTILLLLLLLLLLIEATATAIIDR